MTRLSSDQVLNDNKTCDPAAIEALSLNHRALSNVSCLMEFKNLARLDLKLNSLTSLEGLTLCTNLKWLSVAENKLESLKGIEALTKLTVLNAGKNKLKSMDDIRSITSLRAIILNDNEINSICRLDQMKDLNTLVLSRNPIGKIGDSLVKVKSLTKLSLSYCQLQNISASLKSCVELKELRLAHNDIKSLPAELAYNKNLQNLDLGYNVITGRSDLKVLNSLVNLRNLNLQGNPIAASDKFVRKVKSTLPNLHVFNAKPLEKYTKNEKGDMVDKDSSLIADKDPVLDQDRGGPDSANDFDMKKLKKNKQKTSDNALEVLSSEDKKRDQLKEKKSKNHVASQGKDLEKQSKQKSEEKNDKPQKRKGPFQEEDNANVKKKPKQKSKAKRDELDVIDDGEVSFVEFFDADRMEDLESVREKVDENVGREMKSASGILTLPAKRKKAKAKCTGSVLELLSPAVEVGMGGPSAWDDDC